MAEAIRIIDSLAVLSDTDDKNLSSTGASQ
jgi:hypothetical protein